MPQFRKIEVVGLGYIGLPTAAVFADQGVEVVGIDTKSGVVEKVRQGKAHFGEPNLDALVRRVVESGKLRASLEHEEADAYLTALSDHLFQTRRSQSEGVSPGAAEVEILSEELPHHDVTVRVGGADVPISEVLSAGAAVAAASVPAIDHAPSSDENGATSFVDPLCPAE